MNNQMRENCDCNHIAENQICPTCNECIFDINIDNNSYRVFITTCQECSDGDRFGYTRNDPKNGFPDHQLSEIRERATQELQKNPGLFSTNCNCS